MAMESRLLAQNKPRPFRAHSPGRNKAHPVQHRLRGGMIGGGLGLDGGDAGLFEGPAAGGADSLGGVALMFIFRQKAAANFRLAVFGQALETEVAYPVAGIVPVKPPCGVPDLLLGVGEGKIQHIGVGLDELRVGGAGQKGAYPIGLQGDEKKTFGEKLHDKTSGLRFCPVQHKPGRGVKRLTYAPAAIIISL